MNIKCQWDYIMGKTLCSGFWISDLVTADGGLIHVGTVMIYHCGVFNSNRSLGHCNILPLPKHAIIEIVYKTRVHSRTLKCFKVFSVEDDTHYVIVYE